MTTTNKDQNSQQEKNKAVENSTNDSVIKLINHADDQDNIKLNETIGLTSEAEKSVLPKKSVTTNKSATAPKKNAIPKKTTAPKEGIRSKENKVSKKTVTPKKTAASKKTVAPKKTTTDKETITPKKTALLKTALLKEGVTPKEMVVPNEVVIPKKTVLIKEAVTSKEEAAQKETVISKQTETSAVAKTTKEISATKKVQPRSQQQAKQVDRLLAQIQLLKTKIIDLETKNEAIKDEDKSLSTKKRTVTNKIRTLQQQLIKFEGKLCEIHGGDLLHPSINDIETIQKITKPLIAELREDIDAIKQQFDPIKLMSERLSKGQSELQHVTHGFTTQLNTISDIISQMDKQVFEINQNYLSTDKFNEVTDNIQQQLQGNLNELDSRLTTLKSDSEVSYLEKQQQFTIIQGQLNDQLSAQNENINNLDQTMDDLQQNNRDLINRYQDFEIQLENFGQNQASEIEKQDKNLVEQNEHLHSLADKQALLASENEKINHQIVQIQQSITPIQTKIETLTTELENNRALAVSLEKVQQSVDFLELSQRQLTENIKQIDDRQNDAFQAQQKQLDELSGQFIFQREQVDQVKSTLSDFSNSNQQLSQKQIEHDETLTQHRDQINLLASKTDIATQSIQDVGETTRDLGQQLLQVEANQQVQNEKVIQIDEKLNHLDSENAIFNNGMLALQETLEPIKEKIESLPIELQTSQQDYQGEIDKKFNVLQQKHEELDEIVENKIQLYEQDFEGLKAKISDINDENAAFSNNQSQLTSHIQSLNQQSQDLTQKVDPFMLQTQHSVDQLNFQLEESNNNSHKLKSIIKKLSSEIELINESNDALANKHKTSQKIAGVSSVVIILLMISSDFFLARYNQSMMTDLESAINTNAVAEIKLENTTEENEKIKKISQVTLETQQTLSKIENTVSKNDDFISDAENQHELLKNENTFLTRDMNELKASLVTLQNQLKDQQQVLEKATTKVKEPEKATTMAKEPVIQKPPNVPAIVNPETPVSIPVMNDDPAQLQSEDWILAQFPDQYTIQLLGAYKESHIVTLAKTFSKESMVAYYQSQHQSKPWFVLIHGLYVDFQSAQKAIQSLPEHYQALKPWIRNVRTIQQAISKQTVLIE